jgi:hypothetical protein
MHQPDKKFLAALFGYCVFIKVLPFVLMHFGMDIKLETTYPWTFTPIFAAALFGVSFFKDLRIGFLLPLAAVMLADVLIGLLAGLAMGVKEGLAYAIYPGQIVNYIGLLVASSAGLLTRQKKNVLRIACATITAPTIYFIVSNFGVWSFDTMINYPKTVAGLLQAYVAAVPFYKMSVISTIFYSGVLFSPLGIAQLRRHSTVQRQEAASLAAANRE